MTNLLTYDLLTYTHELLSYTYDLLTYTHTHNLFTYTHDLLTYSPRPVPCQGWSDVQVRDRFVWWSPQYSLTLTQRQWSARSRTQRTHTKSTQCIREPMLPARDHPLFVTLANINTETAGRFVIIIKHTLRCIFNGRLDGPRAGSWFKIFCVLATSWITFKDVK